MYEFKVKNALTTLFNDSRIITIESNLSSLNKIRLKYHQKTIDAISFINIKIKIYFDKRHLLFLMKSNNKIFLRLHKEYTLSNKNNAKLFNQRCDFFVIKRRIDRLTYELELFFKWKIHSIIFIAQLKLATKTDDSYNRYRSHYSNFVQIIDDIETKKLYEVERIIVKRIKKYEKITIAQYFIRWLEYESKHNE